MQENWAASDSESDSDDDRKEDEKEEAAQSYAEAFKQEKEEQAAGIPMAEPREKTRDGDYKMTKLNI